MGKLGIILSALILFPTIIKSETFPILGAPNAPITSWLLRQYQVGGTIGRTRAQSIHCDAYQHNQAGNVCDNLPGLTSYKLGDPVTQQGPKNTPPFGILANFRHPAVNRPPTYRGLHCLGADLLDVDGETCYFASSAPMLIGTRFDSHLLVSLNDEGKAEVTFTPGAEALLDGAAARVYFCSPQPLFAILGECRTDRDAGGPVAIGLQGELTLGIPSGVNIAGGGGGGGNGGFNQPPFCRPIPEEQPNLFPDWSPEF